MAPPPILNTQYLVFTGYIGPDQPNVTQTWLLPPAAAFNQATPATPFPIPFLYIGTGNQPTTQNLYTNDDFVIDMVVIGGIQPPGQKDVNITLQLTGKNAWSTAPAARAALRANFLTCIEEIESTFELSATPKLIPGATAIIAAALVQIMPLPISEVLLYAYGLESGFVTGTAPSVDIVSGMRLRCEPSLRQYVAPPSQAFSGYVATGSLMWDVAGSTASGNFVQAFDAFLGAVSSPQITPPPTTTQPLYSLIDLQLTNSGYKYHRLIYPQNVIAGIGTGDLSDQKNIEIVGANNLTDLRTNPPYKRIFFGRDLVVPEICIWLGIGGSSLQPYNVALGTTVNNVLERFTKWKPLSANDAKNVINLVRFAFSPQPAGSINNVAVMFAPDAAPITDLRALDLPLCAGDALSLNLLVGG